MKKNMKKLLCMIIIVAFCFVGFACGKNENGSELGDGDYTKLTGVVTFFLPGTEPNNMKDVLAAINAKLKEDGRNYTVSFTFEPSATYWQKAPLKINDGFDACWMHASYLASYYSQKILMDIGEYVELYGSKITEMTSDVYMQTAKLNGGMYAIPRIEPLSEVNNSVMVRGDWMDEFGIESIGTLAELENYFAKSYEKLSSTTGAYVMGLDHSQYLKREYCKNYWFPLGSFACLPIYIDMSKKVDGTYKVESFYESEAFVNMANKAREYYLKNYKHANYQSANSANADTQFNNSLLASIWSTSTKISERIDAFKSVNPDGKLYDVLLNPEETKWIASGANMLSVYSTSSHAAHVVDFYNWILSDTDNSDLVNYGIKGVNYNLTEEGRLDFTGIADRNIYSNYFPYYVFTNSNNMRYSKEMSDEDIETLVNWDAGDNVSVNPLIGFTPVVTGITATAYSLVSSVENSYSTAFLYGSRSLDEESNGKTIYDTFISQLHQTISYKGTKTPVIDILIAEIQAQVDKYVEENNL
ncbi:MAG: extracellular solute-binding protein [Christensenellales bacterium]